MVVHTLKSLTVLAGLGSFFSMTWDNNLILNFALLSLTVESLKCELRSVGDCLHRISWSKVKKSWKGVLVTKQPPGQYRAGKLLFV